MPHERLTATVLIPDQSFEISFHQIHHSTIRGFMEASYFTRGNDIWEDWINDGANIDIVTRSKDDNVLIPDGFDKAWEFPSDPCNIRGEMTLIFYPSLINWSEVTNTQPVEYDNAEMRRYNQNENNQNLWTHWPIFYIDPEAETSSLQRITRSVEAMYRYYSTDQEELKRWMNDMRLLFFDAPDLFEEVEAEVFVLNSAKDRIAVKIREPEALPPQEKAQQENANA